MKSRPTQRTDRGGGVPDDGGKPQGQQTQGGEVRDRHHDRPNDGGGVGERGRGRPSRKDVLSQDERDEGGHLAHHERHDRKDQHLGHEDRRSPGTAEKVAESFRCCTRRSSPAHPGSDGQLSEEHSGQARAGGVEAQLCRTGERDENRAAWADVTRAPIPTAATTVITSVQTVERTLVSLVHSDERTLPNP